LNSSDPAVVKARNRARMRRGMFLLPSFFTALNIGAGYFAITQTIEAASNTAQANGAQTHLDWAAIAILLAIPFDSLDGRIARMTNTASDFGRELDSLADVITFGVAPSLLAFVWGFHFLPDTINHELRHHLVQAGVFLCFLFLIAGASRLTGSILWECLFRQRPVCWRRQCIFSTGYRCRRGGWQFRGSSWLGWPAS
jgi:CDP-diacylglycerol--serine O-phosphatidyltransferase